MDQRAAGRRCSGGGVGAAAWLLRGGRCRGDTQGGRGGKEGGEEEKEGAGVSLVFRVEELGAP